MGSLEKVGLLVCFVLGAWAGFAHADGSSGDKLYRFEPAPAWVKVAKADYAAESPADTSSDGSWYLMYDRQINVTDQGDDRYYHLAIQVLNATGLDKQSEVSLSVDPSFQTLSIHTLRLVRNGKVIDESRKARITTLPEESQAEEHIYDGSYNINALLSDVRVGDVIEYEYTLHSRELVFPGHFGTRLTVGWSDPVHWERLMLRYPAEHPLHYQLSGSEAAPEVTSEGNYRQLTFTWQNLPAVPADGNSPDWYQFWPVLEVSDLSDWAAAARIISPFYTLAERARPRLMAAVADIRSKGGTPETQTLAALQFVQENIRYTSIAIGRGSYIPSDPEVVLGRRFGDCKDKSMLLVAMLRQLGISAHPVLVHTHRGPALPQSLPTLYAFDHAIVRAQIGPAVYWLDGTAAKQYSPLQKLAPADYGYALPLDAAAHGLEAIPRPAPDAYERDIHMTLDLRQGYDKPANFDVTTTYYGSAADSMREDLNQRSAEERKANYLNYYASLYTGVKSTGPVSVSDDAANNILVIQEHYVIDNAVAANGGDKTKFTIHGDEMYPFGRALEQSVRHSPLAIDYPNHIRQSITAYLPDDTRLKNDTVDIADPAFHYHSEVNYSDRTLQLNYDYQALADHVDTATLAQYQADRNKLFDDVDMTLSPSADDPVSPPLALAPLPLFASLIALGLGIWSARRIFSGYDPLPRQALPGTAAGFRGWLILPMLNAIISTLEFVLLPGWLLQVVDSSIWQVLPDAVSEPYRHLVQPVMVTLLVMGGLLLPLCVAIVILFFRKRSSAPVLFTALLMLRLIYCSMVYVTCKQVRSDLLGDNPLSQNDIIIGLVSTILWSTYMLRSERVKATFVKRATAPANSIPDPEAFAAD